MIGVVALLGLTLALQSPDAAVIPQGTPPAPHVRRPTPPPTDTGVVATRSEAPVTIDGIEEDAVWREAPAITAFRMWRPTEGGEVRSGFKTEARVAYDAANLYVFVRRNGRWVVVQEHLSEVPPEPMDSATAAASMPGMDMSAGHQH